MDNKDFKDIEISELSEIDDNTEHRFNFSEYKSFLYTILFYTCGIVLGSVMYKRFNSDTLNTLIAGEKPEFLQLFINDFCLYFSIFLLTMFLGYCLIGFPLVNIMPMIIGTVTGIRVSYYYICYTGKGIVYCLIMLIPSAAMLMTVVAMTIKVSAELSRSIYNVSLKKTDMTEIGFKSYLKKYLIYGFTITITAFLDAGITTLFGSVISI